MMRKQVPFAPLRISAAGPRRLQAPQVWSEETDGTNKAARPMAAERLDARRIPHRNEENYEAVWSEATDGANKAARPMAAERLDARRIPRRNEENYEAVWSEATE